MATRRIQGGWTTLHSDLATGNGDFNVVTMYMDAVNVKVVSVTFEVQNTTDATGVVAPGLQTCNVETAPDTPALLSATPPASQTGDGMCYPTERSDVSAATAGKAQVRFGFFMKSSGGLKMCRVRWFIDVEDC